VILTSEGEKTVLELVGKKFSATLQGNSFLHSTDAGFFFTGHREVFRITLENGRSIKATANHRFMSPKGWTEVKDLKVGGPLILNNGETSKIVSIESSGEEDVYDCTIPDVHCYSANGFLSHNCSEQGLANHESCVSGDTLIHTLEGCRHIKDLVGKKVHIFNGEVWSEVVPFLAEEKDDFFRVTFSDGSHLDATPYHEFSVSRPTTKTKFEAMSTDELEVGMYLPKFELLTSQNGEKCDLAYTLGAFTGDGYMDAGKPMLCANEDCYEELFSHCKLKSAPNAMWKKGDRLKTMYRVKLQEGDISFWKDLRNYDKGLPDRIMSFSKESILQFVAGWIDTDGSIRNKNSPAEGYIIVGGCKKKLEDMQILLRRAGINYASLWRMNEKGQVTNYGVRNHDIWALQIPSFECREIPTVLKKAKNFEVRYQTNRAHPNGKKIDSAPRQRIVKIEPIESQPSYCFSEPLKHMGVFGNVLTYQCCLSDLYLPRISSKEELFKCATYLYRICKHSLTLPCPDSKETEQIVHRNMRMGIGVTGYLQATEEQRSWLSDCYKHIRAYDKEYSRINGYPESIKISTTKPSGCSRGDMLVLTTKGLLRLDEIGDPEGEEWQKVEDLEVYTDQEDRERVTKFYVNGDVPTKKIVTEDGNELESSLNHKYRVVDPKKGYIWKTVKDLEVGDMLVTRLGGHPEDIETSLPLIKLEKNTNCQVMIQPTVLTRDLAWFLGLFYGDGSVHKAGIRISFNRKQPALLQWLTKFFEETFGLNTVIDDDHGFYVNSRQILYWLEAQGCLKDYAHELCVPKFIRRASKDNVIAFIDGFWRADGGIHHASNVWSACTVSERFARELFVLCRSVGYNVKISCAGPGGLGSKDRWIILLRKLEKATLRYISKAMKNRFYQEVFWLDPIISLEDSSCETYDIEVENAHHYRLGGTISHNTLSILAGCTPGVHPGFSRYYKRRIRISSNSPLITLAKTHGYPVEYVRNFDGSTDHTTQIVTFPMSLPEHTVLAEHCTAVQQLEWVQRLQREWSDNSVSVTVYYKKDELPSIKEWLKKNYNNGIKTVSFLLHSEHGFLQAPMEQITKEEFETLSAQCRPIQELSGICYSEEDTETMLDTKECAGGACPLR